MKLLREAAKRRAHTSCIVLRVNRKWPDNALTHARTLADTDLQHAASSTQHAVRMAIWDIVSDLIEAATPWGVAHAEAPAEPVVS